MRAWGCLGGKGEGLVGEWRGGVGGRQVFCCVASSTDVGGSLGFRLCCSVRCAFLFCLASCCPVHWGYAQAAAQVIKTEFMEKDPSTMRFTMLALVRWVLSRAYGELRQAASTVGWGEWPLAMRFGGKEMGEGSTLRGARVADDTPYCCCAAPVHALCCLVPNWRLPVLRTGPHT